MPFDTTQPKTDSAVVAHLKQGRERISQGWCQGANQKFGDLRDGKRGLLLCASQAILGNPVASVVVKLRATGVLTQACFLLSSEIEPNRITIQYFNDQPDRTLEDMQLAYDIAVDLQERVVAGL